MYEDELFTIKLGKREYYLPTPIRTRFELISVGLISVSTVTSIDVHPHFYGKKGYPPPYKKLYVIVGQTSLIYMTQSLPHHLLD